MSLCQHCGVEVEDDARYCPLCRHPLQPGTEGEPHEPPPPPVPKPVGSMRRWLLEFMSLLAVTAAIVVFAADFAFGMSLTWARYPLAAIAFVWLATVLLIRVSLASEVAAVSLFLFALDGFTQGSSWFFPVALPLTLLAGTILALTLAIVRMLDLSPFSIIATAVMGAAVFVVGLEMILNNHLAHRWFVSWSAAAFACTLPVVLLLFYLRRRFRPMQAEIRKRLQL
jgi:hypothetical protein